MSYARKIKKTAYASVAVVSVLASLLGGSISANVESEFMPSEEFYKQPYSSLIFDYKEPSNGAARFYDVTAGDWFYSYVDSLVKDGVINGKSNTAYDPSGTLTLPECAALIVRCLGLEDRAREETAAVSSKGLSGSDRWYIGYVKLCVDAGIIPDSSYGFGYDGDNFVMTTDYFESVPVKRYELAWYIYKMTLLDGSSVRAENTYSERGGLGHELIRSGLYDFEAVKAYQDSIADFDSIPEPYRDAVLACYYNGIFNGDEKGNFNPNGSITRAEIAKVVAVLTDISQRFGEDMRANVLTLSDKDFKKDRYGVKRLTKQAGHKILLQSASAAAFDGASLRIPLYATSPLGYLAEVHVYERDADGARKISEISGKSEYLFTSGTCVDVFPSQDKEIIALYVLRNIAQGGEVEGVLELTFNGSIRIGDGISPFSGEAKEVSEKGQ